MLSFSNLPRLALAILRVTIDSYLNEIKVLLLLLMFVVAAVGLLTV